jgi:hypothetical protein
MPDGSVVRSSSAASNDELRSAIFLADHGAVQSLASRAAGRLASMAGGDGITADERQRENLAALERMAAGARREEQARRTAAKAEAP